MPAAADGQASINDFIWYEDADSEEPMHPQSKEHGPANQQSTDGATHMPSRPLAVTVPVVASTPTKKTLPVAAGPKAVQHPRVAELKGKASLKPLMPRSKKLLDDQLGSERPYPPVHLSKQRNKRLLSQSPSATTLMMHWNSLVETLTTKRRNPL